MLPKKSRDSQPLNTAIAQRTWLGILVFVAMLLSAGCSDSKQTPTTSQPDSSQSTSTLALNWFPETEHGGFIAADIEGYFAEQGVKVNVLPGDKNAPSLVISELAAGRIDFAVSDADNVVKARASDVPIVALMAPLQNTPRCIMVHEESGIQKLEELKDVQLAISESRPFAQYMKKKLPLTNVTIVPYNGLVGEFLTNPRSAQQAFVFSEPFLVREQGGKPKTLMVSEIGFNPYASVLITTESMIEKNPELVQKVVTASIEGWQKYLEAPEKTNAHIATLNQNMTPAVLEFGASTMKDLCRPADGRLLCSMTASRWQELVEQIEEIGAIEKGQVVPADCFTTRFLDAARVTAESSGH